MLFATCHIFHQYQHFNLILETNDMPAVMAKYPGHICHLGCDIFCDLDYVLAWCDVMDWWTVAVSNVCVSISAILHSKLLSNVR